MNFNIDLTGSKRMVIPVLTTAFSKVSDLVTKSHFVPVMPGAMRAVPSKALIRIGAVVALAAIAKAQRVNLNDPALSAHAALVYNESPGMHGDLLDELKTAGGAAIRKGIVSDGLNLFLTETPPVAEPARLIADLQRLTCAADAAVVGHTDVWLSHLTASRRNIYTDYDFAVDQSLRGAVAEHIVVTRLGGRLEVPSSGPLKFLDFNPDQFPQFKTNTTYLLLVTRIPATGGFVAGDPSATLIARNGQWLFARKAYSGYILPQFARGALENQITTWAASCH